VTGPVIAAALDDHSADSDSEAESHHDVMAGAAVPLTRIRRAVAKAMTLSATIPQFALNRSMPVSALVNLRKDLPKSVSMTDLINAAIVSAVSEHPRLNASWRDDHIVEFRHVNLGVAIGVEDGLLVPAINSAERLSVTELSTQRRKLTEATLQGRLRPQDLGTATISVSNLGTTGLTGILPMVIPPQAAIIGVPAPGVDGTLSITVACDHRVVDGLPAARFLAAVADRIENPSWITRVAE
jgi:pyruvate dehydrogenase E2 component (dihydrolipoamide acetyltransferase)